MSFLISIVLIRVDYLGQLKNAISFFCLALLFFLFAELLIFFSEFILAMLKYKYC